MYSMFFNSQKQNNYLVFGCNNSGWRCSSNKKIYEQFVNSAPTDVKLKPLHDLQQNERVQEKQLQQIVQDTSDKVVKTELERGLLHLKQKKLVQ